MIKRVTVRENRFHYWQGGNGENLVMVHGVGANLALWHFTLAAALLPSHRLTMYDLRGHGRSDMPATGYRSRDMADDLLGILDALDLPRVSLIGHSFGADIALHLAVLHPERVRRLVTIEAGLPMLFVSRRHPEWTGWDEWTRLLEQETGIRKNPREWHRIYTALRRGQRLDDSDLPGGQSLPSKARRFMELLTRTSMIRDYEHPDDILRTSLKAMTIPTLLVYGEVSSYRRTMDVLQGGLPQSSRLVVPGTDHFSVLQPQIARPILNFLGTPDEGDPFPTTDYPVD